MGITGSKRNSGSPSRTKLGDAGDYVQLPISNRENTTETDAQEVSSPSVSSAARRASNGPKFMNFSVDPDDGSWHYVLVFHNLYEGNEEWFNELQPDPIATAQKIFIKRSWNHMGLDEVFVETMTRIDFHDAVRTYLVELLTGEKMGYKLATQVTIDGDEVFLLIELESTQAKQGIAHRQEIRARVRPEKYPADQPCPTTRYVGGQFVGEDYVPAHMRYNRQRHGVYSRFSEVDILRMCLDRMQEFLSFEALIDSRVLVMAFPVHHWAELLDLQESGWGDISSLRHLCRCPGREPIDKIRSYFGEEVAFFFHWFDFYTQMLLPTALIGILVEVSHQLDGGHQQGYIDVVYAVFICMWSSLFVVLYTRRSGMKVARWGMKDYHHVAVEHPGFEARLAGTWREIFNRSLTWCCVVVMMLETAVVVVYILQLEYQAVTHPEMTLLGVNGRKAARVGDGLLVFHAQLADAFWTWACRKLTRLENLKTYQQLKDATALKLFTVKFVIYYFPFFYIAFIKDQVLGLGCHGADGCVSELRSKLLSFLAFHVVWVLFTLAFPLSVTWWRIRSELVTALIEEPNKKYSFLQAQSKCEVYQGDTDDFIELIIVLGFVMMFSAVSPLLALLGCCSNFLEIRLLAYRMLRIYQRPVPRGQEGIGPWQGVVSVISNIGMVTNAALLVFVMRPLAKMDWPIRLAVFIVMEHTLGALHFIAGVILPQKSITQEAIEERNHQVEDELAGVEHVPVKAQRTPKPVMMGSRPLAGSRTDLGDQSRSTTLDPTESVNTPVTREEPVVQAKPTTKIALKVSKSATSSRLGELSEVSEYGVGSQQSEHSLPEVQATMTGRISTVPSKKSFDPQRRSVFALHT